MKQPIHFDMETQDPDDVMTLAILATHPRVDLVSVSCCPGGSDQVGLVKHVLAVLGKEVMAIGGDPLREKPCVSGFHDKWLGKTKPCAPTHLAADALTAAALLHGCTLLTGGPLKNLAGLPRFHRWVAQGGFAGDSVVPPEHRLAKFDGRETCPTFNFGGAPKVAEAMLALDMPERVLVGKNVCHGVAWDRAFHERVKALPKRTPGMDLVVAGMELYLSQNPEGKKLHDPLAMTVAIDQGVCEFRNVEMYRHKGEWGARLNADSNTRIAISVDRERFFAVLTEA
jgi:pyrimidine-specific ribonucleoside hydrolase